MYRGRFAPSPTGALHLGSLFTALASFLEAKSQNGSWLIRIDDLDTPRNKKDADSTILRTLESFALYWDEAIYYQSQHRDAYTQALQQLQTKNLLYPCECSRKDLASLTITTENSEPIYPRYCREKHFLTQSSFALRIKTDSRIIRFQDKFQGLVCGNLANQHGDFILQRKDQIIAYQLAVVIDDNIQGITHVVRGADLLDSTIKQNYLQNCLNLPIPEYAHVPVICNADGTKLSKKNYAPAVDAANKQQILFQLLRLLKQHPPTSLFNAPVTEQLDWATQHWNPEPFYNQRSISEPLNRYFNT